MKIPLLFVLAVVVACICSQTSTGGAILYRLAHPPTPTIEPLPPTNIEILEPDIWMHADKNDHEWIAVHFVGIYGGCFQFEVLTSPGIYPINPGGCLGDGLSPAAIVRDAQTQQILYGVWLRKAIDGSNRVEVLYTKNLKR